MSPRAPNSLKKRKLTPVVWAVIVHVLIIGFFVVNLSWVKHDAAPPAENIVNAVVVDENKVKQEADKLKQAEEKKKQAELEKKKRLEEEAAAATKKRQDEEQKLKDLEKQRKEEEAKVKTAEQQRQAEQKRADELRVQREKEDKQRKEQATADAERKKQEQAATQKKKDEEARKKKEEDDRKKKAEADRKKQAEEDKKLLDEQLQAEEQAIEGARSKENQRLMASYQSALRSAVERLWLKPPGGQAGMTCTVRVTQNPSGNVLNVNVVNCNTPDENFRRSVESAVYRASPLPLPQDMSLFQREIEFIFSPKE